MIAVLKNVEAHKEKPETEQVERGNGYLPYIHDDLTECCKGWAKKGKEGSIIVVVATDAPVSSVQLERIARRAGLGLARTGSTSGNSSGDLIIAFSTANVIPLRGSEKELNIRFLTTDHIEPIFRATAEATEDAILNALTMRKTMEGINGNVAYQIPYDRLAAIMAKYGRPLTVS